MQPSSAGLKVWTHRAVGRQGVSYKLHPPMGGGSRPRDPLAFSIRKPALPPAVSTSVCGHSTHPTVWVPQLGIIIDSPWSHSPLPERSQFSKQHPQSPSFKSSSLWSRSLTGLPEDPCYPVGYTQMHNDLFKKENGVTSLPSRLPRVITINPKSR